MALRPAWTISNGKVTLRNFEFTWNGGFALVQKQKNVKALHESIASDCNETALEISTKSTEEAGKKLSAFSLEKDGIPIENIFQAAKKYENGGPYTDLLNVKPAESKRDERHRNSGKLICFEMNGQIWPCEPKTLFYDHLYVTALKNTYGENYNLEKYSWFTDIEFNPNKSINCQARAVAIYKLIQQMKEFSVLENIDSWTKFHKEYVTG